MACECVCVIRKGADRRICGGTCQCVGVVCVVFQSGSQLRKSCHVFSSLQHKDR